MEVMSSVFSFLFTLSSLIALFLGIYIIKLNPRKRVNRAFLLLCIALSIWAFGFAMGNSAKSLNDSIFWRRIAAIGWTSIVSITLHLLLLLTKEDISKTGSRYLFLLHIPAIINMYVFSISSKISAGQYNLVLNKYGWTNMTVNNGWDYMYYLYYSLYMILGLAALWKWKKRINDKIKIRQANLIFVSILGGVIVASVTDITLSTILANPFPQMAPLAILIPTWAMYHSTRYYDLTNYKNSHIDEIIATSKDKRKIFYNLAFVSFIGGFLNMGFEYTRFAANSQHDFKFGIIKSIMFFITSIILLYIQNIKSDKLRENLTIIILVVNIPIISFNYFYDSSVTVWIFPILIIISSLIFSKKTLLISTTIVAILTQRLMWILQPELTLSINKYDYLLRIIIFLAAGVLGFYVNKMYVGKIKENDYQMRFQKMHAKVSTNFITVSQENIDEKINELLFEIGLFFGADRAYLCLINSENNTMKYSNEWSKEGITKGIDSKKDISINSCSWWINLLKKEGSIYIKDTDSMPIEAKNEKTHLLNFNVKSLISVTIGDKHDLKGFIGIESISECENGQSQNIDFITILSNLVCESLNKVDTEKEIEFMAYYDNLTGIPNRFLFKDRVKSAISLAERNEKLISIMFIDLDNFKSVNDTMGHDAGDYLLKEVANVLSKTVRKIDTVARFGGDEFMIMLNNIENQNDISKVAENVMRIFSKPFILSEQEFFITASAGIATFPIDGENPDTLIKNADTAMYEAKEKGKNQYSICTANMKEEVHKNMKLSNDLYRSLERNELIVYYQPQVDLINKEITGVEALLRWNHKDLGMISPSVFIPLAEKNNLINIIGEWVLKTACTQNKKWQDMGIAPMQMAVNLSGIQFMNAHIAEDIERILKETKLNPKYLELEITEGIAIRETDFVIEVLTKLKKVGVSIAIDDFGTEYSSLSRLKKLPIDRIKIDMEFIKGIGKNEKDEAITIVIINLAKSLGLNVLAEGVETAVQQEFLYQKMCDYVQGYYYYKPMPADEIEKILMSPEMIRDYLLKEEAVFV